MNDRKNPLRAPAEPLSSLDGLVAALRSLPGVGPKAAQRMALHFLQHDRDGALRLARALEDATRSIRNCERCNTFTEDVVCALCRSGKRDQSELCIVETPADLRSGARWALDQLARLPMACIEQLGSHKMMPGKMMQSESPSTCNPMNGIAARKIVAIVICGGATLLR